MKSVAVVFVIVYFISNIVAQEIQLPAPVKSGGKPIMDALTLRKSHRAFLDSAMSLQQISNLLYAAYGINRSDGKRTAPSAMNGQEFDVFVVNKEGAWLWMADSNKLLLVVSGDIRAEMGKQHFVGDASLILVYVADYRKMNRLSTEEQDFYSAADCGYISQNVYLFSASENLATVVLGYIDRKKIAALLKLDKQQHVIFTQPVGFAIKNK